MDSKPKNTGNKNAVKAEGDKLSATLYVKCLPEEKSRWLRAAAGRKLSSCAREAMSQWADRQAAGNYSL